MRIPKDIEAEIYFLTEAEGGRSTPVCSGYRPQFYYNEQDWDASHIYPDNELVNPGETVRAYLGFLSPKKHLGNVYVGMEFIIREGDRTVGEGVVTQIIELEQSANRANERATTEKPQKSAAGLVSRVVTAIIFALLLGVLSLGVLMPLSFAIMGLCSVLSGFWLLANRQSKWSQLLAGALITMPFIGVLYIFYSVVGN